MTLGKTEKDPLGPHTPAAERIRRLDEGKLERDTGGRRGAQPTLSGAFTLALRVGRGSFRVARARVGETLLRV